MTQSMAERLNELVNRIRSRFQDVRIEFSPRSDSESYGELWVYVLDLKKFDAVRKYCEELEAEIEQSHLPIWILTKTWTGPWPGGEGEAELRRKRREEFKKRMQAEFGAR